MEGTRRNKNLKIYFELRDIERLLRCARNDANPPGPAGLPPLARGTSNLALLVKRRHSHSGDEIRSWHRRCEELSDAAISNYLYYKTLRALTLLPILLFKTGPSLF